MSPCWVELQDVPFIQHAQKQSMALFAAQGLEPPTKSEASPTLSDLNFKCKAGHCKLDRHTLHFYAMVKVS